jgi:hypothetical protein
MTSNDLSTRTSPSPRLLAAALVGLFGANTAGCDNGDEHSDSHTDVTSSTSTTTDLTTETTSAQETSSSTSSTPETTSTAETTSTTESTEETTETTEDSTGPEVLSEVEGNRTFASLEEECEGRGGYIQIHAACSGVNFCRGFSYGDWDPGVLIEHTCAGINGCNGLSCVVLPEDSGKTGMEIYEQDLPETGPRSCLNCHAQWDASGVDKGVFKVHVLPGSGKTLENWLDLPAASQERIVAFGKTGITDDGIAYSNMAAYHKVLSRAEIMRVVKYIREELTPVLHEIKVVDP